MMKHYGSKLLAWLLCMMTVIGLMPVTAIADNSTEATPGQLTVKNAGFEETAASGVPGWMNQRGTLKPKGLFERSTAKAHSGSASLKITDQSDGVDTLICNGGTLGITEGYTYRASAWFFKESGTNQPQMYLRFFDVYGVLIDSGVSVSVPKSTDWKQVTVEAVAPKGAVMARLLFSYNSPGSIYVDDVTLEELPLLDPKGWTKEADGLTSSRAKALPGVEYQLVGAGSGAAICFYSSSDALIMKVTGSRAYAPENAAYVRAVIPGSKADGVTLLPLFAGTQVPDGSFESMANTNTSAWTSTFRGDASAGGNAATKWDTQYSGSTVNVTGDQATTKGGKSLKITASKTGGGGARSIPLAVKAGQVLTINAKYLSEGTAYMYFEFWSDDPVYTVGDSFNRLDDPTIVTLPGGSNWASMDQTTVTVPKGAAYFTLLFYYKKNTVNNPLGYLDDVSIKCKGKDDLLNDNFENNAVTTGGTVTYAPMVSRELVTDGASGLVLTDGSTTSAYIPVLGGKTYSAAVDVKGSATLTLTFYNQGGTVLRRHTTSGTEGRLTVEATAGRDAFAAKMTLEAKGKTCFDNAQLYAITESVANPSFESMTHAYSGKHATQWQSFGDVSAKACASLTDANGALAMELMGTGTEGGIRSSMIKVTAGQSYAVRADISGKAKTQIAFYDAAFNRLGIGTAAPAGAAYACVEILVSDKDTAVVDAVEFGESVIDVSNLAQLFIDDYLIADTNLTRTFHQAKKSEPVVSPSTTNIWESGGAYVYGSVLYDESAPANQRYKMWYQTFNPAGVNGDDATQVLAAYSYSADGVNWTLPVDEVQKAFAGKTILTKEKFVQVCGSKNGLTPYKTGFTIEGSNIIGNFHIMSVFIDEDAPADKRYCMITHQHDTAYRTMYSADGITWVNGKTFVSGTGAFDVVTGAYDADNEQFISTMKIYHVGKDVSKRLMYTTTSADGTSWKEPVVHNTLADLLDTQKAYRADSYGIGYYARGGAYIGFDWLMYMPGTTTSEGIVEVQLAYSRDLTEEWQRPTRTPIVPLGADGAVDDGMIFTSSYAIEVGDEVWLYCGGWDGDHGTSKRNCSIYIAKWRLDGFASMNGTGTLTTKPVTFDGNALYLNSRGKVTVELLDANGKSLLGVSDPISADSVSNLVTWNGSGDLSSIKQPVSIKINATDAEIYSFTFGEKEGSGQAETKLPFVDVAKSDWFYDDVAYVYEKGLMSGTAPDTFAPDLTVNRAMIVTILWRQEGEPSAKPSTFTDVAANSWYDKAVNWAAEKGIVNGYSETQFGPMDQITHEQVVTILYRYAQYKGYDVSARDDLKSFADADKISSWAKDAMQWAAAKEMIHAEDALAPQGAASRARVADILKAFLENYA